MKRPDTRSVFLVQHTRGTQDDSAKVIGVYSDRETAEQAVSRIRLLPGFCDYPDSFHVDRYMIDKDYWSAGFGYD